MASDDVHYGGYRPEEIEPIVVGREGFRKVYSGICSGIPRTQYIRFETITDDGITCAVEWTSIMRRCGWDGGCVCQGGMASYERDADGNLSSVRICDNLGFEKEIDRRTVLMEEQFICE